uniref:Uncharacterized protein n=1 Tax=Utricularia reniformis TaxID=192314 RepID=A0A1Y0AZ17_9LAMI|nr:hypothetical protein AEK19_MT1925 [Utricularia reniformis]ART30416.1 hypothetical protein AEK19_MT1925 [Utricularia reniformis]
MRGRFAPITDTAILDANFRIEEVHTATFRHASSQSTGNGWSNQCYINSNGISLEMLCLKWMKISGSQYK